MKAHKSVRRRGEIDRFDSTVSTLLFGNFGNAIAVSNVEMMIHVVQIVAIMLVAFTLAPALAHAFEFPGKKRLTREAYLTVQTIYYPGFTLLGLAEPGSLIAVIVLVLLTPAATPAFWLTLIALLGLLGMQVVYWTLTHPANKYWLQGGSVSLGNIGRSFFSFDPASLSGSRVAGGEVDWTRFRDRSEYSHIIRAGLSLLGQDYRS
jgi:hypothetical protein